METLVPTAAQAFAVFTAILMAGYLLHAAWSDRQGRLAIRDQLTLQAERAAYWERQHYSLALAEHAAKTVAEVSTGLHAGAPVPVWTSAFDAPGPMIETTTHNSSVRTFTGPAIPPNEIGVAPAPTFDPSAWVFSGYHVEGQVSPSRSVGAGVLGITALAPVPSAFTDPRGRAIALDGIEGES